MDKSTQGQMFSPVTATVKVLTDQGFHLSITLREDSSSKLLEKVKKLEQETLDKGWSPDYKAEGLASKSSAKNSSTVTKVSDETCATCGAAVTKKQGLRKDGSQWTGVFCSTGNEDHKVWLS